MILVLKLQDLVQEDSIEEPLVRRLALVALQATIAQAVRQVIWLVYQVAIVQRVRQHQHRVLLDNIIQTQVPARAYLVQQGSMLQVASSMTDIFKKVE